MAKLVFDTPNEVTRDDLFDKNGKPIHMGNIPEKRKELKNMLDLNPTLEPKTKKIIFVIVTDIINVMNESGFNRWVPDIIKTVFVPIFATKLCSNRTLIRLLEDN